MNLKTRLAVGLTSAVITLVAGHEGLRLTGYLDPLGIPTVGYGHTGPGVKAGMKITQDEANEHLARDLNTAAATVRRCVTVPLTIGEMEAWTSFAYNVGPGRKGVKDGMCVLKSGAIPGHVKLLQAGKHYEACEKLFEWTMPGTNVHNGLKKRRADEYARCVSDLHRLQGKE